MLKSLIFIFSLVVFISCGVEEDEIINDSDGTTSDIEQNDTDNIGAEDYDTSNDDQTDTEKPDVDHGLFCYSGGAVLYEGDQQFKMCPGDFNRVQKQICTNGNWKDEGDCILNYAVITDSWFKMGCDPKIEGTCEEDNVPVHEPRLSEYSIDKFEVTVERFEQCIAAKACTNEDTEKLHYRTSTDTYSCNLGNDERKNHPANCITWYGAEAFCKWAGMRLPTEAEWEKAARSGNVQIYPWGNEPEPDCDYAIMKTVSNGCGFNVTFPVGTLAKGISPFGLFNMAGNVSEYVSDWYDPTFYSSANAEDRDVAGPAEPGKDQFKVCRGGSYIYGENRTRTSFRSGCKMDDPAIDFGFRCAADRK